MVNNVQLTPLEALGVAIKAEIEAAESYERLADLVKNRALLEEAYARQFPDVELVLPAQSLVPRVKAELEGEVSDPGFPSAAKASVPPSLLQETMWDAAVVGAGPAGALAAHELTRLGKKG